MTLTTLDLEGFIRAVFLLFGSEAAADSLIGFFAGFWTVFTIISFLLSAVMLYLGLYATFRYDQLRDEEEELLREAEHAYLHHYGEGHKDSKWHSILEHTESENPNDWRLAIIEADIVLDEALNKAGFVGVSIGDKLKAANPETFQTLQDAWEAHKVRNRIAHSGSDFILTKRVAQETIHRYERVFRELGAI